MTDALAYFQIWDTVIAAVRTRAREMGGNVFEIVEQPARTMAIRAWGSGQDIVQASISLDGDAIEIKRASTDSKFPADETPEIIEVVVTDGRVRFVHDDLDSTDDVGAVADMILAPLLQSGRKPQAEKSPIPSDEASNKRSKR